MVEETLRYKRLDGVPAALDTIAHAWFPDGRQALDLRPALAALATPVQIVWGRDDRIIPVAQAEALAGKMQIHILDAVGHIPQMEKAGEVNRLIARFVGGEFLMHCDRETDRSGSRRRSRGGSHLKPRAGRGRRWHELPTRRARARAALSISALIAPAKRPMRRTGCAAPAMSPRRSPDCRSRSRIYSMSPARSACAGSKALDDAPPATRDSPVVVPRRAAGAVLIGRTNMTEFAFSGVGINPHYGTPGNPYDRRLIPGGSSSGRSGVGRRRAGHCSDRQRYRRLRAHPGGAVRPRRVQADAVSHPSRRRRAALDDARSDRPARQ